MSELKATSPSVEPVVGTLRFANGARRDAMSSAAMLSPPLEAARGREGERLFLLLDLTGPAPAHLYREMRETVAQAYWLTGGSITAALRQAATAANRHLFQFNLYAAPSDRCYGGLACAVLRGEDFFLLVTGPARACVFHQGVLECFPRGEELPHLGMGRLPKVRLYHTFAALGDTLLLASPALVEAAEHVGLARVLPRMNTQEVLAGLEQVGAGAEFTALVGRLSVPSEVPKSVALPVFAPQVEVPTLRKPQRPSLRDRVAERLQRDRRGKQPEPDSPLVRIPLERPASKPQPEEPPASVPLRRSARQPQPEEPPVGVPLERPSAQAVEQPALVPKPAEPPSAPELPPIPKPPPVIRRRPKPVRVGPGLGERVRRGARTLAGGVTAAATGLVYGTATLFRRMLPGAERGAHRPARPRREPPKENPAVMMGIAVGILALVIVVVLLAQRTFGEDERLNSLINQAKEEARLAQNAIDTAEERAHWEKALDLAEEAAVLQPENLEIVDLQLQAHDAIDQLDGVVRLEPSVLGSLGAGRVPRRMIVYGQSAFVLDPDAGWVSELPFDTSDPGAAAGSSTLVRTGDEISGGTVASLIDLTWVEPGGDRSTSGLVILEERGVLLTYDPAWGSESGAPQLTRTFLGTQPEGTAKAVGSWEGRFYVLDVTAPQIWRYEPRNDAYPDQPERYFTDPSSVSLGDAVDMAIDGNIYVLHSDGTVSKFLRGERRPFEVRDVPDGFSEPIALAVDPESRSGAVYIADRGNQRVVVLGPDGSFHAQLRAEGAFDGLEALTVDEAAGRLYVFSSGQLYVARFSASLTGSSP
jgi:hypothetical protein